MGRLFGTDGVRGIAVKELTKLMLCIGRKSVCHRPRELQPAHVIGKDTRHVLRCA